jgi:hypothetical protein
VLYTQHNVSKSDRSYIAGRVRSGYILYLAFAVSMLLLYSAINAAPTNLAATGCRGSDAESKGRRRARHRCKAAKAGLMPAYKPLRMRW